MAKFKIKKDVPFLSKDSKGVTWDGKTIITEDIATIKELRKLPKATAEEVPEPTEPTG